MKVYSKNRLYYTVPIKKKEDCMMQKLELYIHIPFCVKNADTVTFCLRRQHLRRDRSMSWDCVRRYVRIMILEDCTM